MMKTGYRQHQLLAAFMLLLTGTQFQACTSADDTTDQPWQNQPVELTATIAGEANTRTTINDVTGKDDVKWAGGEQIAVRCNNVTKDYKIADAATGKMESTDPYNPFYWQSETRIQALYSSSYSSSRPVIDPDRPISFSVQSDQTSPDNYLKSDLLATPLTTLSYADRNNSRLKFYHQTAKVVVNITHSDLGTDGIAGVQIKDALVQGSYALPTSFSNYGTWTNTTDSRQDIQMYKKTTTSYAALVIPQTIAQGTQLLEFTVSGYSPFHYKVPSVGITWNAGTMYTYNIVIKGTEVELTSSTTDKTWTDGGSGGNTVILPDETYDLSKGQINIRDYGIYMITGSVDGQPINIWSGSPTVILNNISLKNKNIEILSGSPTLIIQGTNTLTNARICMADGTSITIKGQNTDDIDENVLNITNGNIGPDYWNRSFKNIMIEGINATIDANGNGVTEFAGIGSSPQGECGNITIRKSKMNVIGRSGAAAIGCGGRGKCGDIEISNSDITAVGSNYYDECSAAIGCGYGASRCGNITITLMPGQTKEQFENKLTTVFPGAQKVGLDGVDSQSQHNGTVGTITWKDASGNVIHTVAP